MRMGDEGGNVITFTIYILMLVLISGSPELFQFIMMLIMLEVTVCVRNLMAIHPRVVEIFHSKVKM